MSRRWIVVTLLLSSCIVVNAQAQHAGKSIIERLPFLESVVGPDERPQSPPQLVRTADGRIVQVAANSPRAPRDRPRGGRSNRTSQSSGRSIFSQLNLGGLFPGRDEPAPQQQEPDYPMPYEISDLEPQTRQSTQSAPSNVASTPRPATPQQHSVVAQPSSSQPQRIIQRQIAPMPSTAEQPQNRPRDVAGSPGPREIVNPTVQNPRVSRSVTSGSSPSRSSATSARQAPSGAVVSDLRTPTTPRAAQSVRRSPTLDLRRGELQDALADLKEPGAPARSQPSIDPPSAASEAALPSYLSTSQKSTQRSNENRTTAKANPVADRMRKVESLDLSEALLGGDEETNPGDAAADDRSARSPQQAAAKPERAVSIANESSDRTARRTVEATNAPRTAVRDDASLTSSPKSDSDDSDFGVGLDQWASHRSDPSAGAASSVSNQLRASAAAGRAAAESGAASESRAAAIDNAADSFAQRQDAADRSPVLFQFRQPVIGSRVEGPRQLVVGRTAEYQVTLTNSGDTAARELEAQVAVPAWADLVDAVAVNGRVEIIKSDDGESRHIVRWRLYELAPEEKQLLELKLVPREGRTLQLGVRWTHAPVGGETMVEVQEPKLQLELNGPTEVLFGKPHRYQLTLSNPGDGGAEDVQLMLTPPGADVAESLRHTVGKLAPGQSKTIELELTPRDAGELNIRATAVAMGGLEASSAKAIVCRQPLLEVDWRGPEKKYAGSTATYFIRVRNPGSAPTEAVDVSVELPDGVELISASEGHAPTRRSNRVVWQTASLQPEQERFLQLRCRLAKPGSTEMSLSAATRDNELSDARTIQTEVVALADLKMEISDPKGPIAVGDDAVYEVVIRNRGTTAATGVNVVALFSEGIDPTSVDGRQHDVRDGRVTFRPLDHLPAGEEVRLRIHAAASKPGSHIFRAEVTCPELDMKLSAEEATRFFADEQQWDTASKAYADESEKTQRY